MGLQLVVVSLDVRLEGPDGDGVGQADVALDPDDDDDDDDGGSRVSCSEFSFLSIDSLNNSFRNF